MDFLGIYLKDKWRGYFNNIFRNQGHEFLKLFLEYFKDQCRGFSKTFSFSRVKTFKTIFWNIFKDQGQGFFKNIFEIFSRTRDEEFLRIFLEKF